MRVIGGRVALAAAYMGVVLGLSLVPGRELARLGLPTAWTDLAHVPLFAGLAWVTLSAFVGRAVWRAMLTAGLCLAFAATDEWIQAFVPGRVSAANDVGADALGITLGIALGLGKRPAAARWRGRSQT